MARKKKRDRFALTPEDRQRAGMVFTLSSVHATIVAVAGRDQSLLIAEVGSASIADLTQALNGWRWLVRMDRHSIESKRLRERLAEVCRDIELIVPPLRAEVEEALKFTEGADPSTPAGAAEVAARPAFQAAIQALHSLDAGRTAVGENALLVAPETRMPPVDFWQAYAGRLADKFARCVTRVGEDPAPIETALYAFVVTVVPALTGEHVTFEQVRTHFSRKRRVAWTRHRL